MTCPLSFLGLTRTNANVRLAVSPPRMCATDDQPSTRSVGQSLSSAQLGAHTTCSYVVLPVLRSKGPYSIGKVRVGLC